MASARVECCRGEITDSMFTISLQFGRKISAGWLELEQGPPSFGARAADWAAAKRMFHRKSCMVVCMVPISATAYLMVSKGVSQPPTLRQIESSPG